MALPKVRWMIITVLSIAMVWQASRGGNWDTDLTNRRRTMPPLEHEEE
eukprot:CAMPEP_0116545264 /NCGR_PEP_ID=MMETSP0397-20121206/2572_1 /TAXON_ID=216820 /ORGANISM="Cyclophora tenuis, Strain ECT3854" /LENGTH=47 /DNA_ID= /DNA_START= /DNA_END= /DNA_ORIENTATION=